MKYIPAFILYFLLLSCQSNVELQTDSPSVTITPVPNPIKTAAQRTELYFNKLDSLNIGLVVNQSSRIDEIHLVDSLISKGFNVARIFAPEHGFRGNADAGETIKDGKDIATGLNIISLYGDKKKPAKKHIEDLDLIIFDIQDVGVRFYTYISTLHYIMETCAEQKLPLLVLDRPNPNGHYIDGPILENKFTSFVGLHPIPVIHGMTIGEYAKMINGEAWLKNKLRCELEVIPCDNYNHDSLYSLPVRPSPNLKSDQAIALYPSLCFFEGTPISVGRGTKQPFTIYGHPNIEGDLKFTPQPSLGAKNPKLNGIECNGYDLTEFKIPLKKLELGWLIDAYEQYPDKSNYFNSFFNLLAGNKTLQEQIIAGYKVEEIRSSWSNDLKAFKSIRKKYLLYPDFNDNQ